MVLLGVETCSHPGCPSGLRGQGHPACSDREQPWICDGELTPRQLTASGSA